MSILRVWESIKSDASSDGYEARRIPACEPHTIYAAMDNRNGNRILIFRLSKDSAEGIVIPSSSGLEVRKVQKPNFVDFEIMTHGAKFEHPFEVTAQDLIDKVCQSKTERDGAVRLAACIALWQKFFERTGGGGLTREQQRGLYGELKLLDQMIPKLQAQVALESWVGPDMAPQDFLLRSCAVEVKTTISPHHQLLQINHERQLDDTGIEKLFLFHWSLDARGTGTGETLPGLVNKVRRVLSQELVYRFDDKLAAAGYWDAHSDKYTTLYSERERHCFMVRTDFPRITEQNLPRGLGNVQYQLDVAALSEFIVDEVAIWEGN